MVGDNPDRNDSTPPKPELWYAVLTSYPFLYLPVVAVVGILCSVILPILTGVNHR
jgi:hypothetical protein